MDIWLLITFIMIFFVTPILISMKMDVNENFDIRWVFAPITLCWVGLIFVFLINFWVINKYYKITKALKLNEEFAKIK